MSRKLGYEKKHKNKGFVFALEAAISLLLFALMLFSLPIQNNFSLKELAIVQQENDLLRVWSAKETKESEMINDTKQLLGENAELWVGAKQILTTQVKKNSISSEGIILNSALQENKIKIIVYYD
ncbi:MAG: hypothetical protein WC821_02990 [archaeon]